MRTYLWKSLFVILLVSLFLPLFAGAIEIGNPLKYNSFTELLDRIVAFIFNLALWIFPIMIVIAGFFFITAAGDPQKITTAKNIILWASIGLVIVISAKGLVRLFKELFEATGS